MQMTSIFAGSARAQNNFFYNRKINLVHAFERLKLKIPRKFLIIGKNKKKMKEIFRVTQKQIIVETCNFNQIFILVSLKHGNIFNIIILTLFELFITMSNFSNYVKLFKIIKLM